MSIFEDNVFRQACSGVTVRAVLEDRSGKLNVRKDEQRPRVVSVHRHASLAKVMRTLANERVQAVPVVDEAGAPLAFIDMAECVHFIGRIRLVGGRLSNVRAEFFDTPCDAVLSAGAAQRKQLADCVTVYGNDSLVNATELLCDPGIERILVVDERPDERGKHKYEMEGVLTRSDVMCWMSVHLSGLLSKYLSQQMLNDMSTGGPDSLLGHPTLIDQDLSVRQAIRRLRTCEALAVTDGTRDNALIGNFSCSDVAAIYTLSDLSALDLSVGDYLRAFAPHALYPQVARSNQTVAAAFLHLAHAHRHHLWVLSGVHAVGWLSQRRALRHVATFKHDAQGRLLKPVPLGGPKSTLPTPGRLVIEVVKLAALSANGTLWQWATADSPASRSYCVKVQFPNQRSDATASTPAYVDDKPEVPGTYCVHWRRHNSLLSRVSRRAAAIPPFRFVYDVDEWDRGSVICFTVLEDGEPVGACNIEVDWVLNGFGTGNTARRFFDDKLPVRLFVPAFEREDRLGDLEVSFEYRALSEEERLAMIEAKRPVIYT